MLSNIPQELKAYGQWLVWRYEKREGAKDTKVPYNVRTRYKASVTEPSHWCDYDAAVAAMAEAGPNLSGVGFVLTDNDPFAVIDLDDTHGDDAAYQRQLKIYEAFASYAELSPSGNGVHTWLKGAVPHGRKRAFVEVYSNQRFMTMTGNVIRNVPVLGEWRNKADELINGNQLLNTLWEELGGPAATYTYGEQQDQKHSDAEVMDLAAKAANGHKFIELFGGNWQNEYHSQSEADQALMNILAYYTQNRAQLMRLFRQSALGEREKAQRDKYLDYTITKAFDRNLPPLDLEGLLIAFKTMVAVNKADGKPDTVYVNGVPLDQQGAGEPGGMPAPFSGEPSEASSAQAPAVGTTGQNTAGQGPSSPYSAPGASPFPPGLVGHIAQFIYDAAPRPVHDIALAGALGFFAGITGRAYNVSGTGLNQYVLILAPTGTGKEAISNGTDRLIEAVKAQVPPAGDFVGPGEIVSSAGLIKWLSAKPVCYTIVGEFGLKLAEMSSPKANPHLSSVKRVLLDLYHKSGAGSVMQPMAYSDKEKNTAQIYSPALTLIGESVPEKFYEVLDESMVADGLLPRFTIVEYRGKRVPRNDAGAGLRPPIFLVELLGSVMAQAISLAHNRQVHNVPMTDGAKNTFDLFDKWCDTCINDNEATEVTRQLWNRAHIKALKIAALVAVGINYVNPMIDEDCARYATEMIAKQTNRLLAKFIAGEVGVGAGNEARQVREVIKTIGSYLTEPHARYARYGGSEDMHAKGVIRYDHIQRRLVSLAMFREDRIGSTNAIKRAIDLLLTADELREVPKVQMQSEFGSGPRAFMVADPERFKV